MATKTMHHELQNGAGRSRARARTVSHGTPNPFWNVWGPRCKPSGQSLNLEGTSPWGSSRAAGWTVCPVSSSKPADNVGKDFTGLAANIGDPENTSVAKRPRTR